MAKENRTYTVIMLKPDWQSSGGDSRVVLHCLEIPGASSVGENISHGLSVLAQKVNGHRKGPESGARNLVGYDHYELWKSQNHGRTPSSELYLLSGRPEKYLLQSNYSGPLAKVLDLR